MTLLRRNWQYILAAALLAGTVAYLSLWCNAHQVEWWAKQPEGAK